MKCPAGPPPGPADQVVKPVGLPPGFFREPPGFFQNLAPFRRRCYPPPAEQPLILWSLPAVRPSGLSGGMAMRSRRALWSLILPVLTGVVALLTLGPVPLVRASQEAPPAGATAVPALVRENCSAALPLPSELLFEKSEYERILGRFLRAGCYQALRWRHDAQIRPTGPTFAAL